MWYRMVPLFIAIWFWLIKNKFMLHVIGEILVDTYIEEGKTSIFPGGAPFNVACNVKNYLDAVSFYGAVGEDKNGQYLLEFAKSKGFNNLKIIPNRETSRAVVTLDNGERSFHFERDNGADYLLSLSDIDFSLIKAGDIVHIGSLMLSYKEGIEFYNSLVSKLRAIKGVKISFDINYRDDIFPSSNEAKKIFIDALKQADILKFSIEELTLLSNKEDILEGLRVLLNKNQVAVVTLGKDGSLLYVNDKLHKVDTIPLKPVDTTGAGDAFYSYFLSSLVNNPNFIYNDELIQKYLFRCNIVGGIATLKKGAIGVAPKEKEIDEFIKQNNL